VESILDRRMKCLCKTY